MHESAPPVPTILVRLQENSEKVIKHLLPHGIQDGDYLYQDAIKLHMGSLRWFDEQTKESGELHELWMHLKGLSKEDTIADIKRFLLNSDIPDGMMRFDLSPDELDSTDSLYGDFVEIFPKVNFYAGTTTLLAGYNGSGKSTLATQIAHVLAQCGIKGFILSPEMPPKVTAHIIARQSSNVAIPSRLEWRTMGEYVRKNFLFSTIEDRITPEIAFQQFDEAYAMGCRFMVLDSITCIRTGHELYQQADFADQLRAWSRAHPDCYLLVLAHMRKPAGYTGGMISRYDIRGAGEISDLAGHVWLLQRKNPFNSREVAEFGEYDAKIIVDKNRATGELACKMLRFSNQQKLFHATQKPPRYIDDISYPNVEKIH